MKFLRIIAFVPDPEIMKLGMKSDTFYEKEVDINLQHVISIEESISSEGCYVVNMTSGVSYLTNTHVDDMLDEIYN